MTPDTINGAVELIGALFTWRNALQLWRDRETRGVYWPTTVFFAVWGLWNLYYYPALGQWFSFTAGVFLVAGNVLWVVLAVSIRLRARRAFLFTLATERPSFAEPASLDGESRVDSSGGDS